MLYSAHILRKKNNKFIISLISVKILHKHVIILMAKNIVHWGIKLKGEMLLALPSIPYCQGNRNGIPVFSGRAKSRLLLECTKKVLSSLIQYT